MNSIFLVDNEERSFTEVSPKGIKPEYGIIKNTGADKPWKNGFHR